MVTLLVSSVGRGESIAVFWPARLQVFDQCNGISRSAERLTTARRSLAPARAGGGFLGLHLRLRHVLKAARSPARPSAEPVFVPKSRRLTKVPHDCKISSPRQRHDARGIMSDHGTSYEFALQASALNRRNPLFQPSRRRNLFGFEWTGATRPPPGSADSSQEAATSWKWIAVEKWRDP